MIVLTFLKLYMAFTVIIGCHCYWLSLLLVVTVIGCHCYWLSLLLVVTAIGCHCYWLSLLLAVTAIGCHCYWLSLLLVVTVIGCPKGVPKTVVTIVTTVFWLLANIADHQFCTGDRTAKKIKFLFYFSIFQ